MARAHSVDWWSSRSSADSRLAAWSPDRAIELAEMIVREIERDGGCTGLSVIKGYESRIHRLLGDVKLLVFLKCFSPEVFQVGEVSSRNKQDVQVQLAPGYEGWISSATGSLTGCTPCQKQRSTIRSVLDHVCKYCGVGFGSRNQVFAHLQRHGGSCTEAAVRDGMKRVADGSGGGSEISEKNLLDMCYSVLQKRVWKQRAKGADESECHVLLWWLLSSVKQAAHAHIRLLPGPHHLLSSPEWWVHSLQWLYKLLLTRPAQFRVIVPSDAPGDKAASDLSADKLKAVQVWLVSDQKDEAANEAQARRVCERVKGLLGEVSAGKVLTLGDLGQDREVLELLRGCSRGLQEILLGCDSLELSQAQYKGIWQVKLADDGLSSQAVLEEVPVRALGRVGGILAVVKESGVTTERLIHSVGSAYKQELGRYRVESVSRLDGPTSGVLVVPLDGESERHLTQAFNSHNCVQKVYHALVHGWPADDGEITARLKAVSSASFHKTFVAKNGKLALTRFKCIERFRRAGAKYSLLHVEPVTGRTHQIRAHMAHLGFPLVKDSRYCDEHWKREFQRHKDWKWCTRLFLHAHTIRVPDLKGQMFEATCPWSEELDAMIQFLRASTKDINCNAELSIPSNTSIGLCPLGLDWLSLDPCSFKIS